MTSTGHDDHPEGAGHGFSPQTLGLLDRLDNLAHVVVAVLLLLMAATVLVHTCILFVRQTPLITTVHTHTEEAPRTSPSTPPAGETPHTDAPGTSAEAGPALENVDVFLHESLELLSSILFVVIILELLRTIITYLQTHDIQAIMQEFLVVGIISSVRKILLVGAQSSLAGTTGLDFIQESLGTLLNILGILLLIVGLVLLRRGVVVKPEHT